jgi:predicted RNA binding protein YcfA (HicA-like mRNA interferase family)
MSSRNNTKIQRALLKKGFKKVNTDHKVLIFYHDNKKTSIHTKVSHGNAEVSDHLIGKMAKQISLTKPQFEGVIDCNLQKKDLVKIYSELGIL